jgi:hypothetical protein
MRPALYCRMFRTVIVMGCLMGTATAASGLVPPRLQATVFKRIFAYDRALQTESPVVLIPEGETDTAIELAFREVGIRVIRAKLAELQNAEGGNSVVYLSNATPEIRAICAARNLLTISGTPSLAAQGDVTVALQLKPDGRAEILIHRARAKEEGRDLASALLSLSTIM